MAERDDDTGTGGGGHPDAPRHEIAQTAEAAGHAETEAAATGSGPVEVRPAPVDHVSPQLTIRALLTGMLLGGTLSICNVYLGLRIGWGTNMSITGILLAYAFWEGMRVSSAGRVNRFGVLENNINQSACSAAAAVSSAGLVAPIPALTMLTGQTLAWPWLALWVFSVCLVGITVATGLRRQMVVVDRLPFPSGTACAETLREIHGVGKEAMQRVRMLSAGAVVAAGMKLLELTGVLKAWAFPGSIATGIGGGAGGAVGGGKTVSLKTLGFELEPSLLMVGVGGLIGMRAAASILLGAILAWMVIGPMMVTRGHLELTATQALAVLPAEVTLEPEDGLVWRGPRFRLEQLGPMAVENRDRFLAMSADRDWQEAVERIFRASHLDDAERAALGPWTTTVPLRRSIELTGHLADAGPITVPQTLRRSFTVERAPEDGSRAARITSFGAPTAVVFHELRRLLRDAVEDDDEVRVRNLRALLAAAERLRDADDVVVALEVPDTLVESVRFDPGGGAFVVTGDLSRSDADAVLAANPDLSEEARSHLDATLAIAVERSAAKPPDINFIDLLNWLLWPGVTLMVVASLVSFSFSWRSMVRAFRGGGAAVAVGSAEDQGDLPRRWFVIGAAVALIVSVILQLVLFEITWWAATIGVFLSFALAIVASRVAGETNITPVGAMGKVTQLLFGVMVPKNAAANLMTANVTGGAASQCADLMHDFKCGWLLGASPRKQYVAQVAGAFAGALVGSAFYLILIPDPAEMLMTEEWPAPAVAAWRAVAELFMIGIDALPSGTPTAMFVAAVCGVILPVIDRMAPKWLRTWTPSAASVGLAFVVSPKFAVSMFLGATIALILAKWKPKWTARFLVTICAGVIVGDSLVGAGDAIRKVLEGLG